MESQTFENYLDRAYEFDEQEQPEKALQAIEQALAFDHTSAESHNFRGILLEKLGRKEEALSAYETAVRLDANFRDAAENLAGLRADLEQAQKNHSSFRRALRGAGIGAYAFGMSFLLYGLFFGWLRSSNMSAPEFISTELPLTYVLDSSVMTRDFYDYLFLLLRMIACGVGLAFIHRDVFHKSFRTGFLYGFFGVGLGEILFQFYSFGELFWYTYSLVGVFVGLLFALSQKEGAYILPFVFMGALSFGLEPFVRDPIFNLVFDKFGGSSQQFIMMVIPLLESTLVGVLKGVSFGGMAGWFSKQEQTPAIISAQ